MFSPFLLSDKDKEGLQQPSEALLLPVTSSLLHLLLPRDPSPGAAAKRLVILLNYPIPLTCTCRCECYQRTAKHSTLPEWKQRKEGDPVKTLFSHFQLCDEIWVWHSLAAFVFSEPKSQDVGFVYQIQQKAKCHITRQRGKGVEEIKLALSQLSLSTIWAGSVGLWVCVCLYFLKGLTLS